MLATWGTLHVNFQPEVKVNQLTIKFQIKFNNKVKVKIKVKITIKFVVLTFQIIDQ